MTTPADRRQQTTPTAEPLYVFSYRYYVWGSGQPFLHRLLMLWPSPLIRYVICMSISYLVHSSSALELVVNGRGLTNITSPAASLYT